jgi:hypothetical protein
MGPSHGYGSADVRRSSSAGKSLAARSIPADLKGGMPGKDNPETFYEPPVEQEARAI